MRIAVTYDNGMVGQHFGHTEEFKIYDIQDGNIADAHVVSSNGKGHGMLAEVLQEAGASLLICGGIGMGARNALAAAGVELIPGVQGEADEVIKAYLDGTLEFNADETCHHDHEEGHQCGHENGCGEEHHCH